jgi:hypothetical protein
MTKYPAITNDIPATGIIDTDREVNPWLTKLTLQEAVDFSRDYAERLQWGVVIMGGEHRGKSIYLNAANYEEMNRRYGHRWPTTFVGFINEQCDMLQNNINDGTSSGRPDVPICEQEGE